MKAARYGKNHRSDDKHNARANERTLPAAIRNRHHSGDDSRYAHENGNPVSLCH